MWESNLRFLFAVFYPNLHIIFNFALDQATACLRRLICLAFRRFGFKPVYLIIFLIFFYFSVNLNAVLHRASSRLFVNFC